MPDDDAPKSAWEIALEKLQRKDEKEGGAPAHLTAEQKKRIAALRKEYEAKAAELEILHQSRLKMAYSAEDPAAELLKINEGYQRDRRRVEEEREERIGKVRDNRGA